MFTVYNDVSTLSLTKSQPWLINYWRYFQVIFFLQGTKEIGFGVALEPSKQMSYQPKYGSL